VTASVVRCSAVLLLAFAWSGACTKESSPQKRGVTARAPTPAKIDDSAAGSIDLGGTQYHTTTLTAIGSVAGTIRIPDSTSLPSANVSAAAAECARLRGGPAVPAKNFANTVVWIADVKTGKPFPIDKRADLASERCLLDPRVQAVVVGTTVDVVNDDKLLHRLVFTRLGTHDTLTVTPFFNSGQVVASERLAKTPGIVEVRCVQHPWTHGYIAVFDHPYFDVTDNDGSFKIDSLPPGSYKLMIWHGGAAQPQEQQVQITAGGTARITK
jgi:hypothetical protein